MRLLAILALSMVAFSAVIPEQSHARDTITWIGGTVKASDQRAFARMKQIPGITEALRSCKAKVTVWKGALKSQQLGYLVFCGTEIFAIDDEGEFFAAYIPIDRGAVCRSDDGEPCAISVQELPSIREDATDYLIRTPHGCAELSWMAEGSRAPRFYSWMKRRDHMYSTAVACDQPVAKLVVEKANCAQLGGAWEATGMRATGRCIRQTSDVGKACNADSECDGECDLGSCSPTTRPSDCRSFLPGVTVCE